MSKHVSNPPPPVKDKPAYHGDATTVRVPSNQDEALSMALIGMAWLKHHAPEKLTELNRETRAEAALGGFFQCLMYAGMFDKGDGEYYAEDYAAAHEYAEKIRQGEVE